MDEKLQRDINDLLHQFEFITTAQAQATAAGTVAVRGKPQKSSHRCHHHQQPSS